MHAEAGRNGHEATGSESDLLAQDRNVRVLKMHHDKSRRRRKIALRAITTCFIVIVIGIAAVAWLTHRANEMRSELTAAGSLFPKFKADLLAQEDTAARETLTRIAAHTGAAREAASDPIWKAASTLPWIGPNFSATSEVAQSADDVVLRAAKPLLAISKSLQWSSLFPGNGSIDAVSLAEASPSIISAANTVELTHDRLADIDETRLLPVVAQQLSTTVDTLDDLRRDFSLAGDVSGILPGMLGTESAKNYLILVQNSAEIRATGGLPGALAVLTVDKGTLKLTAQSTGSAMGKFAPPIDVDVDQTDIFTSRLGTYIGDVNLTPDFPTAALSAKKMWEARHAQKIHGVIALDPVVLAHLLKASGPIELPAEAIPQDAHGLPRLLTGDNVVQTLLSDVYQQIESNDSQDSYFASVSREIFHGLTTGKASGEKLMKAFAASTRENRIFVWSSDFAEQKVLETTPVGGSTSGSHPGGATFGTYFNDGTGAKMDFHIRRTVQLVKECMNGEYGKMRIRVTLHNTAAVDAGSVLPKAVTGGGRFGVPAGTVQTNIVVYGPAQAQLDSAFHDGAKTSFGAQIDGERPVGTVTARLKPGEKATVEFLFAKIVQHDEPRLYVTPTVQPVQDVIVPLTVTQCAATSKG